jgi:hypothetical protein
MYRPYSAAEPMMRENAQTFTRFNVSHQCGCMITLSRLAQWLSSLADRA